MRRSAWIASLLILVGCQSRDSSQSKVSDLGVAATTPVECPAGPGSEEPRLRSLGDGRLLLTWIEIQADGTRDLRMSIRHEDRWSSPITIASGQDLLANGADFPNIIELTDGGFVAAWLESGGGEASRVEFSVSSDSGRTWSSPRRLHRDDSRSEHGFVSLARLGDGALAAWLDGSHMAGLPEGKGIMALHAVEIRPDGTLGVEREVDSRVCDCCQTAAVSSPGGVTVAYRDRSADEIRDIHVMRLAGGTWSESEEPAPDGWKIEGCPVNGPALDVNGERTVIAWFTGASDRPRVLASIAASKESGFSPAIQMNAGKPLGRVGAALLPSGQAIVTWIEADASGVAHLTARVVGAGGQAENPIAVASLGTKAKGVPQVAVSQDQAYLAWTEAGAPPHIRMARLRMH